MKQLPQFEAMSPVAGWLVGWMHGERNLTQQDQTPELRVELGSLVHVRHRGPDVRALILVDGSQRWLELRLRTARELDSPPPRVERCPGRMRGDGREPGPCEPMAQEKNICLYCGRGLQ